MIKDIYILTGPVHSGKTTWLMDWCSDKKNVYGIATPIVQGIRVFYDLHEKIIFPMEADIDDHNILQIGKYIFSKKAFIKAEKIISDAVDKSNYLVIDEIGPLELRGDGFNDVLKNILSKEKIKFKLVLVIRNNILNELLNYYGIDNYHTLGM
jgi:nucleoside-triphosphatase THEP1